MKILWIAQKDLSQDLDSATWIEMAKALNKRDHQIMLITLLKSSQEFRNSCSKIIIKELSVVNRFPFVALTFHLQVIFICLFWLFSTKPDAVITHPITSIFLLPSVVMAKIFRLNTKFILDIRTLPISSLGVTGNIKKALNSISIQIGKMCFDGITVITPTLKRLISERFCIDQKKIGIWMSGVDPHQFCPKQISIKRVQKLKNSFVVMYHGVLVKNRGLFELIEAMSLVQERNLNILLFIMGKGTAYNELIDLVHQLKLEQTVIFHEPVSHQEIPVYIAQTDVGILPLPDIWCWRVSSPLKLFEYLAMEKLVIVSAIEAHTFVLNNCPASIFLKSTMPVDIADGIIKAYYLQNHLSDLGKAGRKMVMKKFTWDHQATELESFIHKL